MTPLLEIRDLTAGYRPDLPIVQGASLTVATGEFVTIIGPNGAGKSTLLKAIAGLVHTSSGTAKLAGQDITNIDAHRLAEADAAFVPQSANVFTTLSIEENLRLGAHTLKRGLTAPRIAEAYAAFPDLIPYRRAPARSLSGGQRQMLAIARALLTHPRLIMLDEPSAGLAPNLVASAFARLRALADSGVAVLMVEQNARAAMQRSDRTYILAEGRNAIEGASCDLLGNPQVAAIYLGGARKAVVS